MTDEPATPAPERQPPLRISEPGVYDLTAEQYHADPVVVPSFSRSIGRLLVELTPAHARAAHPRLGVGALEEDEEEEAPKAKQDRDVGTAAHAMFLRGESVVEKVPFATYQTKAAKALRDEILAAGKVPLKEVAYDDTMHLVDALEGFRARTGAFTKGKPEQTCIWREGDTWCRIMVDWKPDDAGAPLWDLKTVTGRATLRTWTRSCFDHGVDLQAAMYPRGCAEVSDGEMPDGMNFAVVEAKPPHCIRVFQMSPAALELAEARLSYAMNLWAKCMAEGSWPGYGDYPEAIDPPTWLLREWDWKMRSAPVPLARENPALIERMIRAGNLGG